MTSKAHALSREELVRTLTAYSGITTSDGAADGTTLIDSNLIGRNDFISEKTIYILSGDAKDEDKGALSFNSVTGAITLRGTGVSAQIVAGTIFRVLNISSVEIDVADIQEDLGDMADAATSDDMSDITTTSALAKLRLILNRLSSDAFTATIQGAARTELDTILAQIATYFATAGAAIAATVDPGGTERATLELILEDLGKMLAGAGGITTWPAAADIGDGVSMAEGIRAILTSIMGGDDFDAWTNINNTANVSLNAALQNLAVVLGADGANIFNPTIGGSARTDLDAALAAIGTILAAITGASGLAYEQADVAVTINAINASETNVFDLSTASTRYIIRSLRLKCADPGANTITVKLYELVNDVLIAVDTFDIDTTNFGTYHSLMDMFGMAQLAGDNLKVTVQVDAGGPYAVTGQYSHAKTNV